MSVDGAVSRKDELRYNISALYVIQQFWEL